MGEGAGARAGWIFFFPRRKGILLVRQASPSSGTFADRVGPSGWAPGHDALVQMSRDGKSGSPPSGAMEPRTTLLDDSGGDSFE